MDAHLELWSGGDSKLIPLDLEHVSIGRGEQNDINLAFDPEVARLHAVIVRFHGEWCVRDVKSVNGTYLNGKRLLSEQALRPGDEIRVGATRIIFRCESGAISGETVQENDRAP